MKFFASALRVSVVHQNVADVVVQQSEVLKRGVAQLAAHVAADVLPAVIGGDEIGGERLC